VFLRRRPAVPIGSQPNRWITWLENNCSRDASAPGGMGQPQAALGCARTLSARMPSLLPADEVSRNHQLIAVDVSARWYVS